MYVVTATSTVESRDVTVTMTENDETVVTNGLSAGEVVVTDGIDRLQPGASVTVRFADSEPARARQ